MANEKASIEEQLKEELKDELGLTIPPPQLTLNQEPIPNPNLDKIAKQQQQQEK